VQIALLMMKKHIVVFALHKKINMRGFRKSQILMWSIAGFNNLLAKGI
jgi:hypothetical protein